MFIEDRLYPLLKFYFGLPDWAKNYVGNSYLRLPASLKYGNRYSEFLDEAVLGNERALNDLAERKLRATIELTLRSVPAYRDFQELLTDLGDPFEVLAKLPVVSKDDIKRNLSGYLSQSAPASARLPAATGGSTATPMKFFLHKGVTRTKEYAFMDAFHRRAGLTRHDLILALRGRTVPAAGRRQDHRSLSMYEPIKRQLIISSDHLERVNMPSYIEAIRRYRPTFIQAYPSTIYPLARWLKEHGAEDVASRIRGVMLYSENVLDYHMALFKEVFGCPVLKHYGHSERVLMAASTIDDDGYFFWPQYGYFELIDEAGRKITQPGILGEIVGTSFDNFVMPFVRYRTGDLAFLKSAAPGALPGFAAVEKIEGRRQEFLVCRDGRLIAVCGMGAAHSGDFALVDSMQFEQHVPGHFIVKVVVPQPLSPSARQKIVHALEKKTQGGCTAELLEVAEIPRTTRGKHKLLVQHLDIARFLPAPQVEMHEPG